MLPHFWSLHRTLLVLVLLTASMAANAFGGDNPSPFEVRVIRRVTKVMAETKDGWKAGAPCIQVDVEYHKQVTGNPFVHVYFYDKNHTKLDGRKRASRVTDDQVKYTGNPEHWEPNKIISLWYTITEKVENNTDRFTHLVAVFGNKDMAVAKVYPSGEVKDFEFPEKNLVLRTADNKPAP